MRASVAMEAQWMNRVAGIAIGGFGVVTFVLSRLHAHAR